MRRNPRVTLLCYDPRDDGRYLEVRGTVEEMTEDGRWRHLDALDLEVRRAADALLRRVRPGAPRGDRGPGALPDPADARRGARRPPAREARDDGPALVPDDVAVPDSHLDLLTRPIVGVLTTMLPDGQPQSSLVWVDYDGTCARVNTTLERRKGRDMLANPKVSLLVVDPDDTGPLRPDPRRRRARDRGRARTPRRADPEVHPPPALLRVHLPEEQRARETRVICGSTRGGSRSTRSMRENDGPSLLRTRRRRVGASDPIGAYDPTRPQLSRLTTPRDGPSGTREVP